MYSIDNLLIVDFFLSTDHEQLNNGKITTVDTVDLQVKGNVNFLVQVIICASVSFNE